MRAGAAVSRRPAVREAAGEAARGALRAAGLEAPACLFVAATAAHLDEAIDLCEALREVAGPARIVGGCGAAVMVAGDVAEEGPALGVLALEGPVHPFLFRPGETDLLRAAAHAAGPGALGLVLAEPEGNAQRLLQALAREAPGALFAGGGAAAEGGLLYDDDLADEAAAVGLFVPGPARVGVAQSHQVAGPLRMVTACEGRLLRSLDGQPAVEVLASLEGEPGLEDFSNALPYVALAVAPAPGEPLREDDFLTVPLLGVDEESGGLALGAPVSEGTQVAFALRDGMGARRALERALAPLHGERPPGFGVYFDCMSRGTQLYGVDGLDLRLIEKGLGRFPLLVLRTSFELGPAGGAVAQHLFTGVLGLSG